MLPFVGGAGWDEPGHPLFVPASTGGHRLDNPHAYDVLYGETTRDARSPRRSAGHRGGAPGSPSMPGSVRALVTYHLAEDTALCDLDDAARLVELGLRPSRVVTRDRQVTQAWALDLFDRGECAGVRWWSYYDPDWGSVGLWDVSSLTVTEVNELTVDHPAFVAAAAAIVRIVE